MTSLHQRKYHAITAAVIIWSVLVASPTTGQAAIQTDVLVVGASEGGVAAAIQAARLGARVIVLEDTDWIGGQMTAAGVTSMDGHYQWRTVGLYQEFISRVKQYYDARNKPMGTCYWSSTTYCFEPSVGQRVLYAMIADVNRLPPAPRIAVVLRDYPVSVLRTGNTVTGVTTKQGKMIMAKIVIDATEYGDVLALSPARYRVGNTTSDAPNPNACVQDITYTAVIKRYPPNGMPSNLRLVNPPPGYWDAVYPRPFNPGQRVTARDQFAALVARHGAGVSNWITQGRINYPVNFAVHNAYRGMPDTSNPDRYTGVDMERISKTHINWANDWPASVGALDRTQRQAAHCAAKLHTLRFLYYMQQELDPTWSVANDEGMSTSYNMAENSCPNIPAEFKAVERQMSVIPYVRESRRLVGVATLTGRDLVPTPRRFASSVAMGDYPVDLHGCSGQASLETSLGDTPEMRGQSPGPFQLPLEIFIPETVDGLLVGTGRLLSQSRMANGATRLQPVGMLVGQAAGTLAALSVQQGVAPRRLRPSLVQEQLLSVGDMLVPFSDAPSTHPAFKAIQVVTLKNIMAGYGNWRFGPNDRLTRAQGAVVLTNTFGWAIDPVPTSPTFSDVPVTHWGYKHIEALYRKGMTAGCSAAPRRYCPEETMTRAELAVLMVKSAGYSLINPSVPTYTDIPQTFWAYRYVETATARGLFVVPPNRQFQSAAPVTRGDMAQVVDRYLRERRLWP